MRKNSQFKWVEYLQQNRQDINMSNFKSWCTDNRPKKQVFDTEKEILEAISLYDNIKRSSFSSFNWKQYIKYNKIDININNFKSWCIRNRPKKSVFNTEQELLDAIIKYNKFNWQQYLQENRPDISINTFRNWCTRYRTKKCVFDTEQELLEAIIKYNNRHKRSDFNWKQYLEYNRSDINIHNFANWCKNHRDKKSVFDTEQELLGALLLYNNRPKFSAFNWQQYLQDNRKDINIGGFKSWCTNNRQKKQIFNTEQELIETLQVYDNRPKLSAFNWQQYLQENRQDISINNFKAWCNNNRPKKTIFDTKDELIQTLQLYDIAKKYILRKTKYQGIYNLIEKETGLKFNFYRLEDMIGLL